MYNDSSTLTRGINDCFVHVCIVPNSFPDPKTLKNVALNAKDM